MLLLFSLFLYFFGVGQHLSLPRLLKKQVVRMDFVDDDGSKPLAILSKDKLGKT